MKQIKTINALVKELVLREGLKKQVEIAQVREIVGHLSDMYYEAICTVDVGPDSIQYLLFKNGKRRAAKKKK